VELQHERTDTAAKLDALTTAAPPTDDPGLLDELPMLAGLLQDAPPKLIAGLLEAFDIQAVYHKKDHQVTIRAVLTDDTPQAITDLLASLTPELASPTPGQAGHDRASHGQATQQADPAAPKTGNFLPLTGTRSCGGAATTRTLRVATTTTLRVSWLTARLPPGAGDDRAR
jgi:hypothetical protein